MKGGKISSRFNEVISKLGNLASYDVVKEKPGNAFSFLVDQYEFYIPITGAIDMSEEKDRLMKELDYNKGFLVSVQSKLANQKFVANAKPEIVENEKKKLADAENKIKAIEEQLASLS